MSRIEAKFRVVLLAGVQVLAVGAALAQGARAAAPEWQLGPPTNQAAFDGVRQPGLLVPNWANGFMIARAQGDSSGPGDVNVVLYDRTGTRATQARIWLPGAVRVHLYDAIATDQGGVIASGYAVMADRTTERFVARTDPSGKVVAVVKTNPFNPECVCLSSDGTVWSLGVEADKEDRHEDYPLVRHYSFDHGLLGAYLARNSFPRAVNPAAMVAASAVAGTHATYLRCAGGSAWVYINPVDQVVNIDPSTNSETRFQVDMASLGYAKVRGFAVTDDGHLFAGLANCRMPSTRLFELQPGRSILRAKWVAVDDGVPAAGGAADWPAGSFTQLWGAEGQSLVIEKMGEPDRLSWVPVTRAATQVP